MRSQQFLWENILTKSGISAEIMYTSPSEIVCERERESIIISIHTTDWNNMKEISVYSWCGASMCDGFLIIINSYIPVSLNVNKSIEITQKERKK